MAACLLAKGHAVTVWNRSPEKTALLAAAGAKVAASPREAVTAAEVVITMLSDGPAVTDILFAQGIAEALKPGTIVIDMSSIPPATARDHATRLAAKGILHLDAPVSGGTKGAAAGTLAIMAGGAPETFEKAKPVLEAMGRPMLIGPAGTGQVAKLANQAIVGMTIAAVAEALLLAAANGADPAKVREALAGGFADSAILKQHGQRMLERSWIPGAPVKMQVKDMRTIMAAAREAGLTLPVAERVTALYEDLLSAGHGGLDHSSVLLELEHFNKGKRLGDKPDQMP